MRLIFCYVGEFRNIVGESFNFSMDFSCSFTKNCLRIERRELSPGKELLLDPASRSLSVIVGKTGSGKTNLLELIGMSEEQRLRISNDSKYLLLYSVDPEEDRFAVEFNRIVPKGFASGKKLDFPCLIFFTYKNGKISNLSVKSRSDFSKTVIIHSFDIGASRKGYFNGLHTDGVFLPTNINPRLHVPYDKVNPEAACWYAREYIRELPDNNIKRDAEFRIKSINWSFKLGNELAPTLMETEYRFYHDYLEDKEWKDVRDVPAMFKRRNLDGSKISFKEQFIHDLLTDFALYLRKWAAQITPMSPEEIRKRELMGIIVDNGIKNCDKLPDGNWSDLRELINWLCQYLDLHTDEMWGNRGLLWQIGTDIVDIADALEAFDDSYFEDGLFVYPIEEIEFDDRPTRNLFERMGGYRGDQLGVFSSELLPFEITFLSSGEYQQAKVLGILNEFSSTVKVRSQQHERPDSIILLLDEPETFMHPDMSRRLVHDLMNIVYHGAKDWDVQVIMTTHSPFILSDLLPEQILRISFDEDGFCKVIPYDDRPTFAGDIFSIMARDFFLEYNIGEHSRRKISSIIEVINSSSEIEDVKERIGRLEALLEVIPEIGDPLIQSTLSYMINKELSSAR